MCTIRWMHILVYCIFLIVHTYRSMEGVLCCCCCCVYLKVDHWWLMMIDDEWAIFVASHQSTHSQNKLKNRTKRSSGRRIFCLLLLWCCCLILPAGKKLVFANTAFCWTGSVFPPAPQKATFLKFHHDFGGRYKSNLFTSPILKERQDYLTYSAGLVWAWKRGWICRFFFGPGTADKHKNFAIETVQWNLIFKKRKANAMKLKSTLLTLL